MAKSTYNITRNVMTALVLAGLLPLVDAAVIQPKPVQIGMAKSFLTGQSETVIDIAADDFKKVLKKLTGLDGEFATTFTALEIAERLDKKQLDFGILHAHEFAWTQKKHPQLRPLLVAVNKSHVERAYLIVHKNNPAKTIADLQGKKLDMPVGTDETGRMFLAKLSQESAKKPPAMFFSSIEKSASQTKALDAVAFEKLQAAVIDTAGLAFYKEIKGPTFTNNLRVLTQSEEFPPAVVVYKEGALDQKLVDQFKGGLLKAHTIEDGREMMKEWKVDAFEAVPKNYANALAEILKAYPPP